MKELTHRVYPSQSYRNASKSMITALIRFCRSKSQINQMSCRKQRKLSGVACRLYTTMMPLCCLFHMTETSTAPPITTQHAWVHLPRPSRNLSAHHLPLHNTGAPFCPNCVY